MVGCKYEKEIRAEENSKKKDMGKWLAMILEQMFLPELTRVNRTYSVYSPFLYIMYFTVKNIVVKFFHLAHP